MMDLKPDEVNELKSRGELTSKLYDVCQSTIKWHDKEYLIHNYKTQYKYFRMETNNERIKELSRIFIKILKKDIPANMF